MINLQGAVFQGQGQKENRSSDQKTAREIMVTHLNTHPLTKTFRIKGIPQTVTDKINT
ncbi:MAG UNVERIFIED_CONTAM: hypothetical protein LVR29_22245 [Microcystis novacekii LVE1205-3]|jgi:hypothetical protein